MEREQLLARRRKYLRDQLNTLYWVYIADHTEAYLGQVASHYERQVEDNHYLSISAMSVVLFIINLTTVVVLVMLSFIRGRNLTSMVMLAMLFFVCGRNLTSVVVMVL